MGTLLQIRNVPEDTRNILKARAAQRGESLNSYLLDLIDRDASQPTAAEVLERARRRTERIYESSAEAVAAERDARDERLEHRAGL